MRASAQPADRFICSDERRFKTAFAGLADRRASLGRGVPELPRPHHAYDHARVVDPGDPHDRRAIRPADLGVLVGLWATESVRWIFGGPVQPKSRHYRKLVRLVGHHL